MDKSTLNTVSELQAFEAIPKAKEGEKLEDYVKRAYPQFEESVSKSKNPVVLSIASDSEDEMRNAISKLSVRTRIVELYCQANDPFTLEPPKEATDEDILKFNGVQGSAEQLQEIMGAEAFEAYLKKLKTPKKDGISKRELDQKRDDHYGKYEPVMPSSKEFTHGSGGTTRGYHWDGSIQTQYLSDHQNFLSAFGLTDSFPVIEAEKEAEPEPESEKEDKKGKGKKS